MPSKSREIKITGLVQGVGFRPFIYRIATRSGLTGWVQNTNENVLIRVTGEQHDFDAFMSSLDKEIPPAAIIENLTVEEIETENFDSFTILGSHNISDEITGISPDIAVCNECLADMEKEGTRLDYPFVNCTNCGPRFTIIQDLPYDRAKTTMHPFTMCKSCRDEYESIADRRFHAQPVACSVCGPRYELFSNGKLITHSIQEIIKKLADSLDHGAVALIKGLGGMHLACDAFNVEAIEKLRNVKNREGKPFAVMFRDLVSIKHHTEISQTEEESLLSWRRPIVLLKMQQSPGKPFLAKNLSSGLNLAGVMLPYMPFHYLLFKKLTTDAIVLTSGNFSKEPILIDNDEALRRFSDKTEIVLLHDREIYNRTDDSVVRVMNGKERVLRRSRGYVPAPVNTKWNADGILAFGAELTNCFCIGKGNKAILSQHIGDLQELETTLFYEKTIDQFLKLFRIKPSLLAVDMHPGYISTKNGLSRRNLPVVTVQHHHAHIASCMAENQLDEKVIGIAFDGTGYGEDGNIWGGEVLVCDLKEYKREFHFEYVPLPGGDLAAEEPWRMAVTWLYKVFGREFIMLDLPFLKQIDHEKIRLLIRMIDKKVNCPLTSGAGRLFDTVSALLGLCHVASYSAEGPMRLESLARENCPGVYSFTIGHVIRFDQMIREIVDDIIHGMDPSVISAKFHNTIISVIFESSEIVRKKTGINKIALSGGVFQNKYLMEGSVSLLEKKKFKVYTHATIPANDGGIALGQLAVAAKRRESGCV